ncbi:hypothetical protein ACVXHB_28370 [Escherichia coli]
MNAADANASSGSRCAGRCLVISPMPAITHTPTGLSATVSRLATAQGS